MWTYNDHQVVGAHWALATIREDGLAYLAWQERTRKTGTALLTVEISLAKTCLIVTKFKALEGWQEHFDNLPLTKDYTLINYESIHKIKGDFDFIILDEAHHAISGCPKPSKAFKAVREFTKDKPVLYLSATPYAEHLGLLFHQLKLSTWTPFKFKNFYDFFRAYGKPSMTRTPYGLQETYKKYQDEAILTKVDHLFDFKTRKEVGIKHEPTARLIKIPMSETTLGYIATLLKEEIIFINDIEIVCDSPMKMRMVHYQLESGMVKYDENSYVATGSTEKLDYIKENYRMGDIAIMCHFIGEREMYKRILPHVPIYSADGDAEGVDLSHIAKIIVPSMSFKTSKYAQRLARQANHDREEPIEVDILVGDEPCIGYDVYKAVAIKKENFDKNSYERALSC